MVNKTITVCDISVVAFAAPDRSKVTQTESEYKYICLPVQRVYKFCYRFYISQDGAKTILANVVWGMKQAVMTLRSCNVQATCRTNGTYLSPCHNGSPAVQPNKSVTKMWRCDRDRVRDKLRTPDS